MPGLPRGEMQRNSQPDAARLRTGNPTTGARASGESTQAGKGRDAHTQQQIEALQLQLRIRQLQLKLQLHERRQSCGDSGTASPRAPSPAGAISAPATLRRHRSDPVAADPQARAEAQRARARLLDEMHARGRAGGSAARHTAQDEGKREQHAQRRAQQFDAWDAPALGVRQDSALSQASTCASRDASPTVLPGRDFFRSLARTIKARHASAGKTSSDIAAPSPAVASAASFRWCAPRHSSPCTRRRVSCHDVLECSASASHTWSMASISSAASSSPSSNGSVEDSNVGDNFEHSDYSRYYGSGLFGHAIQERIGRKFKLLEIILDRAEKCDSAPAM